MGINIETLVAAKKFTSETVLGGGAVVGKNVTISSITPIDGGNRITFSYTLDNGTTKTSTLDVMDGVAGKDGKTPVKGVDYKDGEKGDDGIGITSVSKTKTEGLVDTYTITFSDGSTFEYEIINGQSGSDGKPGKDGVSPTITENADNTDKIYKLDVTTVDGTFTTPNLRGKDGSGSSSGEENVIESIKVNGVAQTIAEDKSVNITVPTVDVDKNYVDTELAKKASTNHTHTTVNGHTVESNVPVDAKFTDTVYDDSTIKEELTKKANVSDIPSLDGYVTDEELKTKGYLIKVPSEYITEEELNAKGYLTSHQDISGKVDKVDGKSLIADAEIERLKSVKNYDDTWVRTELENKVNSAKLNIDFDDFLKNVDIDYEYDSDTNANYIIIRIYKQRIDGKNQYPFVYVPNGQNAATKSTLDMNNENNFFLAINAGIFNTTTMKPEGILIQNSTVIQNSQSTIFTGCRPLLIDVDGNLSEGEYNVDAEQLIKNNIVSAVCGFMAIIKDYKLIDSSQWNDVEHYTQNTQRQIIGQFGNGDYAILTCEGRSYQNSDGWTIEEAQKICLKHGLKFAYNLDGGGSTEIVLGKKHFNTIYENSTGRIVPSFIVFNGKSSIGNEDTQKLCFIKEYTTVMSSAGTPQINYGTTRCTCLASSNLKNPNAVVKGGLQDYYLINIPENATKLSIISPDHYAGLAMWNYDSSSSTYKRVLDPGWNSNIGSLSFTFESGQYDCLSVNFKNNNNSSLKDVDTSEWNIIFE